MTDTKTIHDMLIQIEGGDNDMEVINQAADRLLYLEDACRVKDLKFDRLCKDMDARKEYVEELKRIIANQRATFEEIARTSSSTRIRRLANEVLK